MPTFNGGLENRTKRLTASASKERKTSGVLQLFNDDLRITRLLSLVADVEVA